MGTVINPGRRRRSSLGTVINPGRRRRSSLGPVPPVYIQQGAVRQSYPGTLRERRE